MPFWSRKKVQKPKALGADRASFCAALIARLDAAEADYRFDEDSFAIFSEDSGGVHFLRNAFDEYAAGPAGEREQAINDLVRRISLPFPSPPDTWAEARANVMPRLRNPAYSPKL